MPIDIAITSEVPTIEVVEPLLFLVVISNSPPVSLNNGSSSEEL